MEIRLSRYPNFLHTISDFERMGDHALNVARTAKELYDKKIVFSDEARYELNVLIAAMKEIVTSTVQAFSRDDLQMAARIEPLRELIGMLCDGTKNASCRSFAVWKMWNFTGFCI